MWGGWGWGMRGGTERKTGLAAGYWERVFDGAALGEGLGPTARK